MNILAVDPGNVESAYVILTEEYKIIDFGKVENSLLLDKIKANTQIDELAIEMVASYGMAVGETVFETVFWIGRFWEAAPCEIKHKIYRKDEKINLCGTMKAKDANIRQALIDRFGVVGTKANQGYFYGFKADIWAAMAVGVTYIDIFHKGRGWI